MGIAIIKGESGANALGRTMHNVTPKDPNRRKPFTNGDLEGTIWEEVNGVYKVTYINLGLATQHYEYALCDSDGNELLSLTGVNINLINGTITLDSNYDGSAVYAKVVPIIDDYYNTAIATTAVLVIGESAYTLDFDYNNSRGIDARPLEVIMTSFAISEDGVVITNNKSELNNVSVVVKENINTIFSSNDINADLVIPGNVNDTSRDLIVTIQGIYNGVPLSKSFILPQGADTVDTIGTIFYNGSLVKGTTIDPNDFETTATYLSGKTPYQLYGISVTPDTIQNSTDTYTVTFEGNKSGQIELVPEDTLKVAYASNVSTDVKDGEDTLLTVGSSATSGRTLATNKTELNLVATTNSSETFIGYSDLGGNLITNPVNITLHPIVVPKVKGNLMYVKDMGYEWSDYLVSSIDRYRLYKKTNSSFCASAIIWTTANNPLKFTIASLANQTIKFRSINPVLAGGTFEASHNREDIYKMVTLTLDSNGSATYTPLNTGMVVFNFAIKDVEGYTKFTTALLDELQINYAKVSAWSIPSVNVEHILYLGGINESIVYYNNYIISFRIDLTAILIIDLTSKTIVRTITPSASIKNSLHGNAAALMPIKYDENDLFPMIMVSGDGSIARIIRLTGSTVNSLTAAKVCDWHFTYSTEDWGGMAVALGPNLYYLKWSTLLYKINLDITDISNYVDKSIDVTSQASVISLKIIKTGLDIEVVPTSRGNLFISEYGPESDYWNAYIYSSDRYYLNGITISNLSDEGNIVGFVPFYGVRFNLGEPDGITYAGDNVFYIVINTGGLATLYRLTIPFPEF